MSTSINPRPQSKRRHLRLIIILSLIALLIGAALFYLTDAYQPNALAESAMLSDANVSVSPHPKGWIVFSPTQVYPDNPGLIFYPGGKVAPESYAPLAHALAAQGITVVIIPMPFNLAVFAPDAGLDVPPAFPNISNWAVGGHSLGGVMSASILGQSPRINSLVLLGSYLNPPQNFSQNLNLQALVISASQDQLVNSSNFNNGKALLPPATTFITIQGGNHGQFGAYGPQAGDGVATISPQAQTDQVAKAIGDFLKDKP